MRKHMSGRFPKETAIRYTNSQKRSLRTYQIKKSVFLWKLYSAFSHYICYIILSYTSPISYFLIDLSTDDIFQQWMSLSTFSYNFCLKNLSSETSVFLTFVDKVFVLTVTISNLG